MKKNQECFSIALENEFINSLSKKLLNMKKLEKDTFLMALTQELIKNLPNWYGPENWDSEVLPYRESFKDRLFTQIRFINQVLFRNSLLVKRTDFEQLFESISTLEKSHVGLAAFHQLLQDDYSRSLLILLIAHRRMGYRKVKLPLNTPHYWAMRKSAFGLVKSNENIKLKFRHFVLQHMDLRKIGYPIELFFNPGGVAVTFMLKQYEYQKNTPNIRARVGDYVLDAGGCWGDTALYFAQTVGLQGKVFTFEFASDNLEVLHRNLAMNPELSSRIEVISKALWNKSGEEVVYSLNGPATSVSNDNAGALRVLSLSIDDFVKEKGLPRIDFIKMDIEGSELKALQGAEKTLRTFSPSLAIAIYHNDEDFIAIPNYLENLKLGYEFYLDHFTIYRGETILFASAKTSWS
jgi:FkbM family methyltransferase